VAIDASEITIAIGLVTEKRRCWKGRKKKANNIQLPNNKYIERQASSKQNIHPITLEICPRYCCFCVGGGGKWVGAGGGRRGAGCLVVVSVSQGEVRELRVARTKSSVQTVVASVDRAM
jgi:hypothetical protein